MALPIGRNSDGGVRDWMLGAVISDEERAKLEAAVTNNDDIVDARAKMEECARTGEQFHVDENLSSKAKAELREYAQVVGMDQGSVITVTDNDRKRSVLQLGDNEDKPKEVPDRDAFGIIDSFADPSAFEKSRDWDKVAPTSKVDMGGRSQGTVARTDGVETYEAQREIGVRSAENSIAAPNNIRELIETDEKSSRDVIRESNRRRQEATTFDKDVWEAEQAAKMEHKGVLGREGIAGGQAGHYQEHTPVAPGQHSIFTTPYVPDQTEGEKLAEKSEEHRASIQRDKTEDRSWDAPTSSNKPVVSDLLFEGLKKEMAKIKNDA